jgi:KaiC/GvpD/RAD55 family RecA-like ATPase
LNYGLALVGSVLESRSLADVLRLKVTPEILPDDDSRLYWELIKDHHERYGEVPSPEFFRTELAHNYTHRVPDDDIRVIVDKLREGYVRHYLVHMSKELGRMAQTDPWKARQKLFEVTEQMALWNREGDNDAVLGDPNDSYLEKLAMAAENEGQTGTPWPWDYFNTLTGGGIDEGNVYYFYGQDKVKKTWLLIYLAMWFAFNQGLRVLIFTREMTLDELKERFLMLAWGGDLDEWRSTLKDELPELRELWNDFGFMDKTVILTDVGDGLSGMRAKITQHNPDIIMHDAFVKAADDEGSMSRQAKHEKVANTIDMLTEMAKRQKYKFILVGHANREAENSRGYSSSEHAWSHHITRKVDGAFYLHDDPINNRLAVRVNTVRNGKKFASMTLDSSMVNGFGNLLAEDTIWLDDYKPGESGQRSSSSADVGKELESWAALQANPRARASAGGSRR